jgi:hypothetical protein
MANVQENVIVPLIIFSPKVFTPKGEVSYLEGT